MTKPHLALKSHLYKQTESAQRLSGSCFYKKKCFGLLSGLSQEDSDERMLLPKGVLSGYSWNDPLCKLRETWDMAWKNTVVESHLTFPLMCLEMI